MLYVVAGTGDMPAREARSVMDDLWAKVDAVTPADEDLDIAFLILNQAQPGYGFQAIISYVTNDSVPLPHKIVETYPELISIIEDEHATGGDINFLALFSEDDDANDPLNATIVGLLDLGIPCYALNQQMMAMDLEVEEDGVENDDTPLGADPADNNEEDEMTQTHWPP